jgi:ADP-ribose pyrophosphatase
VGQTLIELPAGTRQPDESPEKSARRELQEETGYLAGRLEKLAEFFTSPGIVDERMHAFIASDLSAGSPMREPNEQIENLPLTWEEAMDLVNRGVIQDGKTLVTLLLYERRMFTRP